MRGGAFAAIIIKRFGARGNMVGVAQLARATGCGPVGPGFESLYPPHQFPNIVGPLAQLAEQGTFNPKAVGSTPIMYIHFTAAVLLPLFFVLSEIDV